MYVGENDDVLPALLFGAALAGRAYVPVSYRVADDRLRAMVARTAPSLVVGDEGIVERLGPIDGAEVVTGDSSWPSWPARDRRPSGRPPARRRRGRLALHQRDDRASPRPRCCVTTTSASYVLATVEFLGCRGGRSGAGERAAVPRRRHLGGASLACTAAAAWSSSRRSIRSPGSPPPATNRSPTPWSCPRCSDASSTCSRVTEAVSPHLRHLSYGGGRMPRGRHQPGDGAARPRRLRQRLRPHRDQLHDLGARPGRPPRRAGERRSAGPRAARLGRPAGARRRGGDP